MCSNCVLLFWFVLQRVSSLESSNRDRDDREAAMANMVNIFI